MSDLVGKRLALGNYEILSVLGQGGMATVYRARQHSVDREVAVKIIAGQIAANPDFIMRFKREASMISKLEHPHILPVYDFGDEDGMAYLVMRLVDGGTLDQRMRTQRLSSVQTARIFSQVASALTYSHQRGIIHRDLKPNNILLDRADNSYLMDFGIAKVVESNTHLTATGMVMGTPAYMAPEQWRAEAIDARTDIYALGIMLYQMLTGKLPFVGDTPFALMYQHMEASAPSPITLNPQLPPDIKAVLDKALAKRKEDRYASADEFAAAVNQCLIGGTAAVPVPVIASTPKQSTLAANAAPDLATIPGTALNDKMPLRRDSTSPRVLIMARADETQPFTERLLTRLGKSFGVRNVASTLNSLNTEQTSIVHTPNVIRSYDAVLVVIGAGWLSAINGAADRTTNATTENTTIDAAVNPPADQSDYQTDQTGERWLNDPHDPLRRSLEAALTVPNLIVIPLLINGAQAPIADALPVSLRALASREAYPMYIRNISDSAFETEFERDSKGLIKEIEERTGKIGERHGAPADLPISSTQSGPVSKPSRSLVWVGVPLLIIALAVFGGVAIASRNTVLTPTAIPTSIAIAIQPTLTATVTPTSSPTNAPPTITQTLAPTTNVPPTSTLALTATLLPTVLLPTVAVPTVLPPTELPPVVLQVTIATVSATASPLPPTNTPTLAPTGLPTTPPATYNGPLLVIYRAADTLTFYVSGSASVSLVGITIETDTTQGQHLTARLDQYPAFLGLPFNNLKLPVCFHLENKQRPESPPLQCRQLASSKLFSEMLSPADLIWYDLTASEARSVNITRGGVSLGQCAGSASECDLPLSTS